MKAFYVFFTKGIFMLVMLDCFIFTGCMSRCKKIKLTAWNVQTFFDSRMEGTEYSEFAKSKQWNDEAYRIRLNRLCSAIKEMDSDVFVMEEIENERVMNDIGNILAGEWNYLKRYRYACFAKKPGSAIGCGVISRFPFENMSVHSIDVRGNGEIMPSVRPIIQVDVKCGADTVVLLVNHWKSKSGDSDSSFCRINQERLLCSRVKSLYGEGRNIIACGDFNQTIDEFDMNIDGFDLLRTSLMDNESPGTYFFRDEWSCIDHIFSSGVIKITDIKTETGLWCDAQTNVPFSYKVWNGSGYSDHLPVSCCISF